MKKLFSKKGITVIVIALIIAVITGVSLTVRSDPGLLTNSVNTLLAPIKSVTASVARVCEKIYGYMHDYDRLIEENSNLRAQLAGASQEERKFKDLEEENRRLRELLELARRNSDYTFDTASIISWSASNWESTFTISKGSLNSDIEVNDCIITSSGEVVGVVQYVSGFTSVCKSLLDPTFSASVLLNNVSGAASAKGDYNLMKSGLLKLEYINDSNMVLTGDTVVTSGKGGIFPDGLLVGYITGVTKNNGGLGEYASIEPAADLDVILDVYVITEFEITE